MAAFAMSASALSARVATPKSFNARVIRKACATPSRRVHNTPTRAQAVVAPPTSGEGSNAPKPKPGARTEAFREKVSPLSAENAQPVNIKPRGEPVRIKIDDQWYDCAGWAKAHPGGERWIHFFDGRDGTDVFYALHSYGPNGSTKAIDRLAKLPKCDPPPVAELKEPTASEYATSMSFRDFRKKLEKDGFFNRNVFQEVWALTQVVVSISHLPHSAD
jgi:cytochrome b involved in lipid metabolism|tara:strand:+ start:461 stop:1114 length:654 start_codon:yes stop_codon:yes gene_type:complete